MTWMKYDELLYPQMGIKYSYDSATDNLLDDFYIPMLGKACRYDRISGFFSSTSLAIAAKGIIGLINNDGRMRLITCQRLSKDDAAEIEAYVKDEKTQDEIISRNLKKNLEEIEDNFKKDHVAALGWMLKNHILDMKIAVLYDTEMMDKNVLSVKNAILHQKVGLLYDKDFNGISFSGSNNESATGWLENIEEFKVFKSWERGQYNFFNDDKNRFENLWNADNNEQSLNTNKGLLIRSLPVAVEEKLLQIGKEFSKDRIALKRYYQVRKRKQRVGIVKEKLSLYSYQKSAVELWKGNDNKLLLEMATGTGKTRTAIGCIQYACEQKQDHLVVIIATPQVTLTRQWMADIQKLNVDIQNTIECDGDAPGWKRKLPKELMMVDIGLHRNLLVYTTHDTACSDYFIDCIRKNARTSFLFFIGDEVHGMGATKSRYGLLPDYTYRLGLSATPRRWFDDEGTELIQEYFGNKAFEFTLHDALTKFNPLTGKPFLVNYWYYPVFVSLTEEELEQYIKVTRRIVKYSNHNDIESKDKVKSLLMQRAEITKNAYNKLKQLEVILDQIGNDISDTIIFASPNQIKDVLKILASRGITAHQVTEHESQAITLKSGGISERQKLLKQFSDGKYQILVAIKCMDEGIDIPTARRGIIISSSTNPREYVQRIGRVIRQAPGKENAEIYDFIVKPNVASSADKDIIKIEKKIYEKEKIRVQDIASEALNEASVIMKIAHFFD